MAVQWTEDQKKVIELRDRNILVSAAAGSGKTAVLVERILEKITDEKNPVDIDRMVVVTFTKAAAGEMKERIRTAIDKRAAAAPDNIHLQRQKTLIHRAHITTIDSFCRMIIQNHFQEIEQDPSVRIGDDGELRLLKSETVEEVLEEAYAKGDSAFLKFVETYATGKKDEILEKLILDLYEFSMSYPWPKQWLENSVKPYEAKTVEELNQSEWMDNLMKYLRRMISSLQEVIDYAMELVHEPYGPFMHEEVIGFYKEILEKLKKTEAYEGWYTILKDLKHPDLSRKPGKDVDVQLRNSVKELRNDVKEELDNIKKRFFIQSLSDTLEDFTNCRESVEVLTNLTAAFMEAFHEKKRDKNIVDYHDLEHDALNILIDHKGCQTETAKEYGAFFDEILIDEYQDSNLVQELLLTSVSKKAEGKNNLFMVGDSKQSIYSFRLARPELFMEKFHTYSTEDSACQRIDLHRNFRSRGEVLDSINYIFSKIMQERLGGIEYNEEAALYTGASYPESVYNGANQTELLLFEKNECKEEIGLDYKEYEAKIIAHRIKELTDKENCFFVVDKRTGEYRPAKYRDIVILLRSPKGYAEQFLEVMASEGIPAHMVTSEGYFDAIEVVTLLNLLRVVDNPIQDIPLAAVMKSPIAGITDEELAMMKADRMKERLYYAARAYIEDGENKVLKNKLKKLFHLLENARKKEMYLQLHEFIWYLLDETGYEDYVSTMPAGEQRRANIEMLLEKAIAFEKTSYLGLFQFVQYIEQLQKYEVDFGEASILNERDNTVQIMSIHKSKGLEFPIVFVAGLGKAFNQMDSNKTIVTHPHTGIGVDYINLETRQKNATLMKRIIQQQTILETMGEELRVLYVALTRAKEKLILVGGKSNLKKQLETCAINRFRKKVPYLELCQAKSYLDWIISALIQHKSFRPILEQMDIIGLAGFGIEPFQAEFNIQYVTPQSVFDNEFHEREQEEEDRRLFLKKVKDEVTLPDEVRAAMEYSYPYIKEMNLVSKMSVSELKRAGAHIEAQDEEVGKQLYEIPDVIPLYPEFMKEEKKILPTALGSAYHKVLEVLDWNKTDKLADIEGQLEGIGNKGFLEKWLCDAIKADKIYSFVCSNIGQRMKQAEKKGQLYREQPFVLGIKASELDKSINSDQMILVQGIIDSFFEEDQELVVVDYKTDYVKPGEEDKLVKAYAIQLSYYQKALERLTGKRVKEKILYSLYLNREIK